MSLFYDVETKPFNLRLYGNNNATTNKSVRPYDYSYSVGSVPSFDDVSLHYLPICLCEKSRETKLSFRFSVSIIVTTVDKLEANV